MKFIDELELRLEREEGMFRAQWLRGDVARLRRLVELAELHGDREEYRRAGAFIGWTNNDVRTHELMPQLRLLLDAVYDWQHGDRGEATEQAVKSAWDKFHVERMRRLLDSL